MSFSLSSAVVDLNYLAMASSATGQYLAALGGQSGTFMTSSNLYLSSDYGASWNLNANLPDDLYGAVTSSTTGATLALCSSSGIYTSSDYGSNWALSADTVGATQGCTGTAYSPALVGSASGQYLYTMTVTNGLFRSADYGVTWTSSTGAPTATFYSAIASSPSGQYIVATLSGTIYLSQNYGVSYTKTLAYNTLYYSIVCSDSGTITVSSFGSMYKSTDLGKTWYTFGDFAGAGLSYISADSTTTNMIAESYGDIVLTNNGGANWYTPTSLQASSFSPQSTASNSDGTLMAFGTNGNGIYQGKITYSSGGGSSGGKETLFLTLISFFFQTLFSTGRWSFWRCDCWHCHRGLGRGGDSTGHHWILHV